MLVTKSQLHIFGQVPWCISDVAIELFVCVTLHALRIVDIF